LLIYCYTSNYMETIITYASGRSQGNPGPATVGVYITTGDGAFAHEVTKEIGNATAIFAEYYGVMLALQTLCDLYGKDTSKMQFEIRLENELVKMQLQAEAKINEPGLVPMFIEIHNMKVESFPSIKFTQVSPEQNKEAARFVTKKPKVIK